MCKVLCIVGSVLLVILAAAPAPASTIDVGSHILAPNQPDQLVPIYVSVGAGGDTLQSIQGLNFNIQIADGSDDTAAPFFTTDPDILTGTIFAANNTGPSGPAHILHYGYASTTTAGGYVPANGLLGTVTISTVGFTSGTYLLEMSDTLGGPTDFGGVPVNFIEAGSITIAPEPSSLACLVGLLAAGPLVLWLRKRRGSR
jgi:hypothetical protein